MINMEHITINKNPNYSSLSNYIQEHNNPLLKAAQTKLNGNIVLPSNYDSILNFLFQTKDTKKNTLVAPNFQLGMILELDFGTYFNHRYIDKINSLSNEYLNFYLFKHITNASNDKNENIYDSFQCSLNQESWKFGLEYNPDFRDMLNNIINKLQNALLDKPNFPAPFNTKQTITSGETYALATRFSLLSGLDGVLNQVNDVSLIQPILQQFSQDFELGFEQIFNIDMKNHSSKVLFNEWRKINQFIFNSNPQVFQAIIDNVHQSIKEKHNAFITHETLDNAVLVYQQKHPEHHLILDFNQNLEFNISNSQSTSSKNRSMTI